MRKPAPKFTVVYFDGFEWQVSHSRMSKRTAWKVARELEGETHVIPAD